MGYIYTYFDRRIVNDKCAIVAIEFEKAKKNSSYIPISSKELDIKREMRIQKYYDTHRSRDFQHDHWKHELSNETLREIMTEPLCQKVLKILNYPR